MEKNEIVKSEIGSEAAWRGFSTQTLYIAKRLLTAEDDEQLYPEQVEDLMIMRKGKIIELVQVKNLSDDLSLSDLSPKKNDSFFRRCLKFKKSEKICLKIVSFGNIGPELQNMQKKGKSFAITLAPPSGPLSREIVPPCFSAKILQIVRPMPKCSFSFFPL